MKGKSGRSETKWGGPWAATLERFAPRSPAPWRKRSSGQGAAGALS